MGVPGEVTPEVVLDVARSRSRLLSESERPRAAELRKEPKDERSFIRKDLLNGYECKKTNGEV